MPLSKLNISKPWVIWACSALLEGASKDQVLRLLIESGADEIESRLLMDELIKSPILEAALTGYSRARREINNLKDELYKIASQCVHKDFPIPETFHNVYIAHNVPVHIPGFCAKSPCFEQMDS